MYSCFIHSHEAVNISNEDILEKKRKKLEVKYMECLKEFYLKNNLMNNNCDVYIKEYERIHKGHTNK